MLRSFRSALNAAPVCAVTPPARRVDITRDVRFLPWTQDSPRMRIALDAMGGDYAPRNTIAGAVMALKEYPKIRKLFLTGDQAAVRRELQEHGCGDPRIEVIHTTQVVEMSEHAVDAIRRKKD